MLGVTGSVLLHVTLVLALVSVTAKAKAPPGGMGPIELKLLDEKTKLHAKAEPMITVPVKLADVGQHAPLIEVPCLSSSYRGIGVRHFFGPVVGVGQGTPAERAGLKEGDIIVNDEILGRDRYQTGQRLMLRIERDGVEFDMPVTIGEICEDK